MKRSRLWWMLAALPVAGLPLVAQESAPPAPAAPPTESSVPAAEKPAATPAESPAPQTPAPSAATPAEPAEVPARETAPEEQVSADNNLSFPVDI